MMKKSLDKIHDLPRIPKVARELLQSIQNDDAKIEEIASKITMDQAISAKVLRMANSAHYGGRGNIGSIDDAIVRLGFNSLRTLVIASGVTTVFSDIENIDKESFWVESFTVAVIAKEIATMAKEDKETAFTCGLLHNIGFMLICLAEPTYLAALDEQNTTPSMRAKTQQALIGYTEHAVGSALAVKWGFPKLIQDAIAHQAQPEAAEADHQTMTKILYLATSIFESGELSAEYVPQSIIDSLRINKEELASKLADLRKKGEEFYQLLNG